MDRCGFLMKTDIYKAVGVIRKVDWTGNLRTITGTASRQSIVYENGVKNGAETWWGENGFKSHETHYLMGNLHGKTYSWNEKGHLISEVEYADGKPLYPVKEFSREGVEQ